MRSWARWLALMTVRTRAIDLRTSWLWAQLASVCESCSGGVHISQCSFPPFLAKCQSHLQVRSPPSSSFFKDISGSEPGVVNWRKKNAHLAQLRLGTTGNLLGAQSHELLLELIELLLEILLVLAPKLLGSDLAGRLFTKKPPVSISSSFSRCAQTVGVYHFEGLSGLWWSLSSSRVAGGLGRRRSRSANSEIGRVLRILGFVCGGAPSAEVFRR